MTSAAGPGLPDAAGLLAAGLWYAFLRRRLGGMCGDALGAGIEVAEVGMLLVGVVGALS